MRKILLLLAFLFRCGGQVTVIDEYVKDCQRVVNGVCIVDSGQVTDDDLIFTLNNVQSFAPGLNLDVLADEYTLSLKYVDEFTYGDINAVGVYYHGLDAIEILNIPNTDWEWCQANIHIISHELLHFVAERYYKDDKVHDATIFTNMAQIDTNIERYCAELWEVW